MNWQIRRVGTEAVGQVAELLSGSFERSWGDEAIRSALSGRSARAVVAVDGADRAVGVVLARGVADLLEIDQVAVLPSDRRRGAAAALLAELLESARLEGACEARLELAASNRAARRLYEGLGFVVVGRRARYYPDGDDALLLTRAL